MASPFQFSMRQLLVAVAFAAVACTALVNTNPWWVRGSWLAAVGLSFVAVLQAIFRRGERRAFWLGFAIAGWLCIIAGCEVFPGLRIVRQLPEQVTGFLHAQLPDSLRMPFIEEQTGRPADGAFTPPPIISDDGPQDPRVKLSLELFAQQQQPTFAPNPRYLAADQFQSIGEAIWTVLVALLGGLIACWIYRSEAARPAPAS
jgi:hypothetical protein